MIKEQSTKKIYNNNSSQDIIKMGWTPHFQSQIENNSNDKFFPARVIGVRKNNFRVSDGKKEWLTTVTGKIKHFSHCLFPVTGDWVLVNDTVISEVLERKNSLSRGASGKRGKQNEQPNKEQIIAANLDTVFVVCGLDRDFNLRRIERYLTLIYNCGLNPAIILTKADLHQNSEHFIYEVETIAFDVPIHLISAKNSKGLEQLEEYLSPGQTSAMIGSSGAGKSTLLNRLCGKKIQATNSVSTNVRKGKHTTTSRDLIMMPHGGMLIDNPGIREIAFWDDDGGIEVAFPEIEHLSGQCRFSNCTHTHEPGCKILQAVSEDKISQNRLESYQKMKRELEYLSHRQHKSADRVEKERWKKVALKIKSMKKKKG